MARASKKRTVVGIRRPGTLRLTTRLHNLSRHNLGDVTPAALVAEGKSAIGLLREGTRFLLDGKAAEAIDCFFKSAAVACNVTFTARTHGTDVPEELIRHMCAVSDQATHGIKKVMKAVAIRQILAHEKAMHGLEGIEKIARMARMGVKFGRPKILTEMS